MVLDVQGKRAAGPHLLNLEGGGRSASRGHREDSSQASHLLVDGVHVKVVSERAGHANINMTLAVYAAYIPNMQADAATRVDAWLW